MPVDQAVAVTVILATQVTPDQVSDAIDTAIGIGQSLPHAEGTIVAIIIAVLVVARLIWKKVKAVK